MIRIRNRRFVYFHMSPIPSTMANAVQVMKTCGALSSLGVEMELMCIKSSMKNGDIFNQYDVKSRFPLLELQCGHIRFISSFIFRLVAAIKMIIQRPMVYSREIGVCYISGLLGCPFIYELHAVPYKRFQRIMLKRAVRSKNMLKVASITQGVERDLMELVGVLPEDKRVIIPCGADLPHSPVLASPKSEGRLRIGYVGHFYKGKGASLFRVLAERHPEADFHVIGKIEDPALLVDVPDNIVCHGMLPHERAMTELAALDIVLAPYSHESTDGRVNLSRWFSPLKLFEYMAYGKPIICSDLEVIREVMRDGYNGLLVPPNDIDAWSDAITRLIGDAALRERIARKGPELIQETYSYRRRAERIVEAAS